MTQEENLKNMAETGSSSEPITDVKTADDIDVAKDENFIEQSEGKKVGFESEATVNNGMPEDVDLRTIALAIMGVRR